MAPIKHLVAPWIQKTAGVLLKYQDDVELRTIIVKERHTVPTKKVQIDPIFPCCKLTNIRLKDIS